MGNCKNCKYWGKVGGMPPEAKGLISGAKPCLMLSVLLSDPMADNKVGALIAAGCPKDPVIAYLCGPEFGCIHYFPIEGQEKETRDCTHNFIKTGRKTEGMPVWKCENCPKIVFSM
jgi:hypothetical protein